MMTPVNSSFGLLKHHRVEAPNFSSGSVPFRAHGNIVKKTPGFSPGENTGLRQRPEVS